VTGLRTFLEYVETVIVKEKWRRKKNQERSNLYFQGVFSLPVALSSALSLRYSMHAPSQSCVEKTTKGVFFCPPPLFFTDLRALKILWYWFCKLFFAVRIQKSTTISLICGCPSWITRAIMDTFPDTPTRISVNLRTKSNVYIDVDIKVPSLSKVNNACKLNL